MVSVGRAMWLFINTLSISGSIPVIIIPKYCVFHPRLFTISQSTHGNNLLNLATLLSVVYGLLHGNFFVVVLSSFFFPFNFG